MIPPNQLQLPSQPQSPNPTVARTRTAVGAVARAVGPALRATVRTTIRTTICGALSAALLAALLTALLAAPRAGAQDLARSVAPPSAEWRTLGSEHYRVHYPVESEAWARYVAARLEAIRAAVSEEVGYAPPEVVDVVVSDPVAAPNGFALPLLGWPRMVLWTSPPGADSVIGHYRDWAELLAVHEDTHLVHLLRPSRNPLRRALAGVVPLSPVASAPRWVSEGYATVVEGRLTGTGRPHSDLRAAVLRRWALAGKLPSYGRLASDQGSYLGMSMAYLAGSAYLEWLEERAGEGSLRDLWARLTARRARSFEAAFEGVYGDSPQDLWDRFRAETTWRALEWEHQVAAAVGTEGVGPADGAGSVDGAQGAGSGAAAGPWRQGDLWLDLAWATGAPAVSPDGSRFALVLRHREAPPELAVFTTEVDREALEAMEEERRRIAEADPEDVPAASPGPPPRQRLHTLPTLDGAPPSQPRWLPAAEGSAEEGAGEGAGEAADALLLVRYLPDREGFLHPDLFRWTPATGELRRLTRGADLRDPDPAPAGAADPTGGGAAAWAVAVRNRHGLSQLVRVDLATGGVAPLTEPALEVIYDSPRLSPDGSRMVYARHSAGAWSLRVRHLAGGAEEELPLPAGASVSSPAWGAEGIYAVVGRDGLIDVFAFVEEGAAGSEGTVADEAGGWAVRPATRVPGAALAPEPAAAVGEEPAGLFYLSLEPDGLDLRRLALPRSTVPRLALSGGREEAGERAASASAPVSLSPPTSIPPATPVDFELAEPAESRPYGAGPRQEWLPLSGCAAGAAGYTVEAGVRAGDLLGRLSTVAVGAWGKEGAARGGAVASAWRGLPVELSAHLVGLREEPSRQADAATLSRTVDVAAGALDAERFGAELAAAWERRLAGGPLRLSGGAWLGRVERRPVAGSSLPDVEADETSLFASAAWAPRTSRGELWAGLRLAARAEVGDAGDLGGWSRGRGGVGLAGGWGDTALSLAWERGSVSGDGVEARPGRPAAAPWQLFRVGGLPSTLRPGSLRASRLAVAPLPEATLVGEELEAQRVELAPGFLPLPLFWARYRTAAGGTSLGDAEWLSLAGVEWRGQLGPIPLLRLPGLGYRLGGAEILDGPAEGRREWWASLTFSP